MKTPAFKVCQPIVSRIELRANNDSLVPPGSNGVIARVVRTMGPGMYVVSFDGNEAVVLEHEMMARPKQTAIDLTAGERRVNIDPVVRDMYDALKAASDTQGGHGPSHQKQINAAIGKAQKHFKWLVKVTLNDKEVLVSETFPGIWRETYAARTMYTDNEWTAMIDLLYIKAKDSREKGSYVVTGNIQPIEAKNLKNLG